MFNVLSRRRSESRHGEFLDVRGAASRRVSMDSPRKLPRAASSRTPAASRRARASSKTPRARSPRTPAAKRDRSSSLAARFSRKLKLGRGKRHQEDTDEKLDLSLGLGAGAGAAKQRFGVHIFACYRCRSPFLIFVNLLSRDKCYGHIVYSHGRWSTEETSRAFAYILKYIKVLRNPRA